MKKLITEDDLDELSQLGAYIDIFVEGDSSAFEQACKEYGKDRAIVMLFCKYKELYGGPLRAQTMMRQLPFYDEGTF